MSIFSEFLVKLRKEAGFPTAYNFFYTSGGAKALKLTYRNYLRIEDGKSLPNLDKLPAFMVCLNVFPLSEQAYEFVAAWLKCVCGEDAFAGVIKPFLIPKPQNPISELMPKTISKAVSDRVINATPEQMLVITANRDNFLCSLAISHDASCWTVDGLAAAIKLDPKVVAKAIAELKKAKVVKEDRSGKFFCPWARAVVRGPNCKNVPQLHKNLEERESEIIASGDTMFYNKAAFRVDLNAFRPVFQLMNLYINAAEIHSIKEKTKNSALIFIEGRVVKIRDF